MTGNVEERRAVERLDQNAVDRYIERLGLDVATVRESNPTLDLLTRLQTAHVRTIPFENLSIVGDPRDDDLGEGVPLDLDHIYGKLVDSGRGGYCFELNGLFAVLLRTLGFDAHRAAAIVLGSDGEAEMPANHHTVVVSLDRQYIADPGLGRPQMEIPVPFDADPTDPDAAGVQWRIVDNDRPAYDRSVQVKTPESGWQSRFVVDETPRPLSYFEATNDYFSRAPESMWRQMLIVRRKTESGWVELREDRLEYLEDGDHTHQEVTETNLPDLLEQEFGLTLPE